MHVICYRSVAVETCGLSFNNKKRRRKASEFKKEENEK